MKTIKTEKTVTLSDGCKFTVTSHTDKMTSFTYSSVDDVRKDWVRFLTGADDGIEESV